MLQERKDVVEINNNQDVEIIVAKDELRKSKDKHDEHVIKMKKNKDDGMFDLQENTFEENNEIHTKYKEKVLKSLKKTTRRNNEIRYFT